MAAAGRAGKKVLKQEELRRLMREKQRQAAPSKRIEHPFAKYPYWSVVVLPGDVLVLVIRMSVVHGSKFDGISRV